MDDERVRWGRKYLKFTRIVLSIRLVGYNSCVLCCSFLVVDTRSVETTIAVGQNMQMCHSLRCQQIDMSTATRLILGSLSKDDDDGNENVISKYNFSFL